MTAKAGSDSGTDQIPFLAAEVMGLARDDILMHLRFFAPVLAVLPPRERPGLGGFAGTGQFCLYDSRHVLKCYQEEPGLVVRSYLHMLLHGIFSHSFQYRKLERDIWDLAADLAVENVILELGLKGTVLPWDKNLGRELAVMEDKAGGLTAEALYRYFIKNPLPPEEGRRLRSMFCRDVHAFWEEEQPGPVPEQLRKLGRQVKTDLKSFARGKSGIKSLERNLEEVTRERYDYGEILRRFTVTGEEMSVSEDEFDYIYYTYGLEQYGNLPLIEPLEYRESRKVKEFVIAVDTSASCEGTAVRTFLQKTYSILKEQENFFTRINVHIIQCDSQIQDDTRLTCQEDLEAFLREGKLTGFGATDFRPVFEYVEKLREQGEFENLKGLIYFTDGYGIYPERMPDYQVIFAFLEEDENRAPVPAWSMKVVLEAET